MLSMVPLNGNFEGMRDPRERQIEGRGQSTYIPIAICRPETRGEQGHQRLLIKTFRVGEQSHLPLEQLSLTFITKQHNSIVKGMDKSLRWHWCCEMGPLCTSALVQVHLCQIVNRLG